MTRRLRSAAASAQTQRLPNGTTSSVSEARPSLFRRLTALHDRYGFDVVCVGLCLFVAVFFAAQMLRGVL